MTMGARYCLIQTYKDQAYQRNKVVRGIKQYSFSGFYSAIKTESETSCGGKCLLIYQHLGGTVDKKEFEARLVLTWQVLGQQWLHGETISKEK